MLSLDYYFYFLPKGLQDIYIPALKLIGHQEILFTSSFTAIINVLSTNLRKLQLDPKKKLTIQAQTQPKCFKRAGLKRSKIKFSDIIDSKSQSKNFPLWVKNPQNIKSNLTRQYKLKGMSTNKQFSNLGPQVPLPSDLQKFGTKSTGDKNKKFWKKIFDQMGLIQAKFHIEQVRRLTGTILGELSVNLFV